MAPHSSTLAWKNLMDGGAWQAAVHGVAKSLTRLSDFTFTFHFHSLEKEMATHSSVLAWRIPGMGSLVGCRLWGHTELDTTEVTQQQQKQQHDIILFLLTIFCVEINELIILFSHFFLFYHSVFFFQSCFSVLLSRQCLHINPVLVSLPLFQSLICS